MLSVEFAAVPRVPNDLGVLPYRDGRCRMTFGADLIKPSADGQPFVLTNVISVISAETMVPITQVTVARATK